jgi:hypothetical protein
MVKDCTSTEIWKLEFGERKAARVRNATLYILGTEVALGVEPGTLMLYVVLARACLVSWGPLNN